ncbi:MAG: F0F1 ATP synthase subunit A [Oscillospiraceae bacterium]
MDISINGPKVLFTLPIFGGIKINETIVNSWIIIGFVLVLCLFLTHKLEKKPTKKRQLIAEKIVTTIDNLVSSTMGEKNIGFAPYILCIMTFSLLGSLISLLGLRSVTADINVTLGWAMMTFFLVHGNGIKKKGIGYFKGFAQPVPVMLPLNIISEVATPISLSFRHFGNIVAGFIITTLMYGGLAAASSAIGLAIPVLQVGVPAILSVYFDLFSGFMQAFIFSMLTMVFISNAMED